MQLFRCTSHRLAIFLPCREGIAVDSADFWVGIAAVTYRKSARSRGKAAIMVGVRCWWLATLTA